MPGGRDGELRSAPWRAGDTPRIYPTTNGVASARIFPSPRAGDALDFTAYGRSSTHSQSAKTTGVGGEQRGYDEGKKVRGRKRHLLVDTEGLVLRDRVHSAKVHDEEGIRLLLESARTELSCLKHLWVDAGYRGRGRRWSEEALGMSVEVDSKPPKPVPEKVAKIWAEE